MRSHPLNTSKHVWKTNTTTHVPRITNERRLTSKLIDHTCIKNDHNHTRTRTSWHPGGSARSRAAMSCTSSMDASSTSTAHNKSLCTKMSAQQGSHELHIQHGRLSTSTAHDKSLCTTMSAQQGCHELHIQHGRLSTSTERK